MITREQFIAAARSCVGTPVGHRGRAIGPNGALDCVGVPWASCVACGEALPPTQEYGDYPSEAELREGLKAFADMCERLEDAHLATVYVGRQARHLVVVTGFAPDGRIIAVRAWPKDRVVVEAPLFERVQAYFRVRCVA